MQTKINKESLRSYINGATQFECEKVNSFKFSEGGRVLHVRFTNFKSYTRTITFSVKSFHKHFKSPPVEKLY